MLAGTYIVKCFLWFLMNKLTDRSDTPTNEQLNKWADRWMNEQTDRQTDKLVLQHQLD